MAFYKCAHKDEISMHTTMESWLGIWKNYGIRNLVQKFIWYRTTRTVPDVANADILYWALRHVL